MPNPLVYEVNTRCWLKELSVRSARPVTLAEVPLAELEDWHRLGFTHVWLMGVWSSGSRARKQALEDPGQRQLYSRTLPDWRPEDVAGSPYAIADYTVPPELGGPEGLARFRLLLSEVGLKLLLDFVPNHLGLDHPWVRQRPGLFVQAGDDRREAFRQETDQGTFWLAHGRDPFFPAWSDTAQLDYRRSETRLAMKGLLQEVASHCDGVRCDMAMLVLNEVFAKTWERFPAPAPASSEEFWSVAIASVKAAHPDFLFLAEAYWGLETKLQDLGFDYTYDKGFYDLLIAGDIAGVRQHLFGMPPQRLSACAHFLENHDEPRIASLLPLPEHRAAALLLLALPGLSLMHEGQLAGLARKQPVQLVRRPAEQPREELRQWYQTLLTTLVPSAVRRGQGTLVEPRPAWGGNSTAQNFVLVSWQAEPGLFELAVVNLSSSQSQCRAFLDLPDLRLHTWSLRDLLGAERYQRCGEELHHQGLYLDVPPHAAQLFRFEAQT